MVDLAGRVAVVTGAGQGIGLGIARRFAREGCRLILAEINRETGAAAARELGADARFVRTDVGERASIEAAIAAAVEVFGRIDVLVNSAFDTGRPTRLERKPASDFELAMRVNFYGTLWGMQAAFVPMRAQGGGRIINLISLAGIDAAPNQADYDVSKESIRALTRAAAREWARHGVLVNAIAPFAASPAFVAFRDSAPEAAAQLVAQIPAGWMGDPERDIGGVAAFLASEDARYVTGNVIFADGGAHIGGTQFSAVDDAS